MSLDGAFLVLTGLKSFVGLRSCFILERVFCLVASGACAGGGWALLAAWFRVGWTMFLLRMVAAVVVSDESVDADAGFG